MGWMAWTVPTAIFFAIIAGLLVIFGLLHWKFPSRARVGVLGFETQRGDRLFISLLGSALINLVWIGFIGANQWVALLVCLGFSFVVFRWV